MLIKEELISPIHLTQPNEKPRPNFYRQKFFEFNGNISQYVSYLDKVWRNLGKNLEDLSPEIYNELEKYFTPGDIEKNAKYHDLILRNEKKVAPGESIVFKWSTQDLWLLRKPSYLNSRQEELNQFMLQKDLETSKQIYSLQKEARLLNLIDLVEGLKTKELNGTQAQAKGKLNKDLQDAENRDKGEVKDINQTNATINSKSEIELNGDISVDERRSRNEDYIREFINGTESKDDG